MSKKVFLISNRLPHETGGRAAKIASRVELFEELGWEIIVGHVPEPYVSGFLRHLISNIRKALAEDIDLVLSINNPFHLHVHGFITSSILDVPWVAEFRDPILPRPNLSRDDLLWYPAAVVEWVVANYADRVIWLDGIQISDDYFEAMYPKTEAAKYVKISPMGYDSEEFDAATPIEYDDFTITYAGSFYECWIEPYRFIEALERWVEQNGIEITVQFYGDWSDEYQDAVESAGIEHVVETHDFIPHEDIVPVLKGSDALLYIGGDDPQNARNVPSKLFDYIGARTPIIALVDPSFRVAELIDSHDLGIVSHPDDISGIASSIETLFEGEFEYAPSTEIHESYTRRKSTREIVDVMNELCR